MFVLSGHGRTVLRDLVIYALRPTPNTVRIYPDPGYLAGQRNKNSRLNAYPIRRQLQACNLGIK